MDGSHCNERGHTNEQEMQNCKFLEQIFAKAVLRNVAQGIAKMRPSSPQIEAFGTSATILRYGMPWCID